MKVGNNCFNLCFLLILFALGCSGELPVKFGSRSIHRPPLSWLVFKIYNPLR